MAPTEVGSNENHFCLNDYDCIGFDMDHTMIQYHLPEIFKLIYTAVVDYLVTEKGYCESILHVDNFSKHEDFSLRGLLFQHNNGNFVKVDGNGYVLSCSHGMTQLNDEEIIKEYGEQRLWPHFDVLKTKVYHGDGYTLMENFFLMPAASIIGQLVEDADKKNNGCRLGDYGYIWKDVALGLSLNFNPASFENEKTFFFPSIKRDTGKYVKKISPSVINWLKMLRSHGKIICLITDSYGNFVELLMKYAIGENWKDLFDYVIAHAHKPDFFKDEFKERQFHPVNDKYESSSLEITNIKQHTMYTRGHSKQLLEVVRKKTGKDSPKIVYFGDSIKSDIYPPCLYAQWDTVAVLEELEAEEVHFHKNGIPPLLKEEKLLIASNQWGSFFTHPTKHNSQNEKQHPLNTFWADLVYRYSKLAIPLIDYITDLPIDHKYVNDQLGFYPSLPRSVLIDDST